MRENFFWHKLHSLTGIIPVGYYLVQHLMLNTFSLGGAAKFNGVIGFFEGMPFHFLLALKLVAIWIPLIFHAVYGVFITARGVPNYDKYKYVGNRTYTMQRVSGILALLFLVYHMASTSVAAKIKGVELIQYEAWADKLASGGTYLLLIVYVLGILVCTYHFAFGLWLFCIRWGITISERAQNNVYKLSQGVFVVVTLMGWLALAGFFFPVFEGGEHGGAAERAITQVEQQMQPSAVLP